MGNKTEMNEDWIFVVSSDMIFPVNNNKFEEQQNIYFSWLIYIVMIFDTNEPFHETNCFYFRPDYDFNIILPQ